MEEQANVYVKALHDLNNIKDRECDYAQINTLQGIINRFAEVIHLADAMAEHIAAQEGKTKQDIMKEFAV